MRGIQASLLLAAAAAVAAGAQLAQEKAGARDMFFGGFDIPTAGSGATTTTAAAKKGAASATTTKAKRPPTSSSSSVATTATAASKKDPATKGRGGVPLINAVNVPLGLRYSISRVNGTEIVEVPPSTRFKSGDRIQLKVQTNSPGYLYVVTQGSSGSWQVMFPSKSTKAGSNLMESGEEWTRMLRFDAKPGVEKLFVMLSRTPEKDLDAMIYNLGGGGTRPDQQQQQQQEKQLAVAPKPEPTLLAGNLSVSDPLVARLRTSYTRDLILEEVATPEREERAVYVVSKAQGPQARVVADIKLIHE